MSTGAVVARSSHSPAVCHSGKFVGSSVGSTSVIILAVMSTPWPNNFDVSSASSSAVVIHVAVWVTEYE